MSMPIDVAQGLPIPLTPLIGRQREVAAVSDLLRRDDVRLVTIIGPGGVGKTRLASAVLNEFGLDFIDGVLVVSLGPVHDPALVGPAIAQAIGMREEGELPIADQLAAAIGTRSMLLLLDCFERVTAASMLLSELLAACRGLKILVTSRVVLHLAAEYLFPLSTLSLPDEIGGSTSLDLARQDAVRLFVERARAAGTVLELDDETLAAVAGICRRLDGLPLAIELAAARTRLFPPDALLARLERVLPTLTGGPQDAPERHRTLASTISWSYDLLPDAERRALRNLAVFAAGFTIEAAAAIGCEMGDIAILTDHSLLAPTERPGGGIRFGMLDTVREFALDRLAESGEADEIRHRHAAWCLALVASAKAAIGTVHQQRWMRELHGEHDNLRGALRMAEQRGDDGTLVRLSCALWRFWYAGGFCTEGRLWLTAALDTTGDMRPGDRIELLIGMGTLAHAQGDEKPALDAAEKALTLARNEGDRGGLALGLALMGIIERDRGDYDRAAGSLQESLSLARDLEDPWGNLLATNSLAIVYQLRGDYERAEEVLEESAQLAESQGDVWNLAQVFSNMAHLCRRRGDFDRATELYKRSSELYREVGYGRGEAGALTNLGRIAERLGDIERAIDLHEQSLAVTRVIGDQRGTATTLANLGLAWLRRGEIERSLESLRESLEIRLQVGDREGVATSLENLAEVAAAVPRPERAVRLWAAAAALRDAIGAPLAPSERMSYDVVLTTARSVLGDDRIAAVWAEGRALSAQDAVRYAASDDPAAAPEVASRADSEEPPLPVSGLTARELDVLRLLEEHTDREIADLLYIGPRTVATHVTNILNKLGVNTRTAAVGYAIRHGYI